MKINPINESFGSVIDMTTTQEVLVLDNYTIWSTRNEQRGQMDNWGWFGESDDVRMEARKGQRAMFVSQVIELYHTMSDRGACLLNANLILTRS